MDGIIVIQKEKDYTSHDVVAIVKRIVGEKVGHTGTLDPNATGVLPILIGQGTKISKYLINHDKVYEVILKLGEKTETADGEGNVIEKKEIPEKTWEKEQLEKVLQSLVGESKQIPPMYSAIKVKGKKLYEYARKGQTVEVEPRNIRIDQIELLGMDPQKQEIQFRVSCSKGTYIRSLCEDIASKLDTVGYMKELNRTVVGEFCIEQAITIKQLEEYREEKEWIQKHVLTIEDLFIEKEELELSAKKLELFLNGVKLEIRSKDGIYRIYTEKHQFIGLGILEKGRLKRDVIVSE